MTIDSNPHGQTRHDLLTYVHHIVGFTELMVDDPFGMDDESLPRLQAVLAEGRKLNSIIAGLFDPAMSEDKRKLLDLSSIRQQILQPVSRIIDAAETVKERWAKTGAHQLDDLVQVIESAIQLRDLSNNVDISLPTGSSPAPEPTVEAASREPLILVVDDNAMNRDVLSRQLTRMGFRTEMAENGREALAKVREIEVDLVLLDIMMPDIDGMEVLRQIKASSTLKHLPVIMISALDQVETVVSCIQSGAADYLTKPFEPVLLKARVSACIQNKRLLDQEKRYRDQIENYNLHLEDRVRAQVQELTIAQLATIFALSKLAESRDPETGGHLERMREYSRVLAMHMGRLPRYASVIDRNFVDCIYGASPLHDIGKVGVPDGVLQKPGKLTDDEFELMKGHTSLGAETLRAVYAKHASNDFIRMGIEIAESHHEKFDGSGYPNRLAGELIPLSARIVALADVYDALTSKRCYKDAMTHEQAAGIIREQSGRHFDPEVVETFFTLEAEFQKIAHSFAE